MNDSPPATPALPPLPRCLDQVCDRFEAAWKKALAGGARPIPEDFLAGVSESELQPLLIELLALEIGYRQQLGEAISHDEYRQRFPGLMPEWLAQELGLRKGSVPQGRAPELSAETLVGNALWPTLPGYELLGEVGRGGMGVVYKARQLSLNRTVAIKVILDGRLATDKAIQRFRREAQAAALLDHPNIVSVHDIGEHNGQPYFTMSFVEGSNLREFVRNNGLPAPQSAAAIVAAIADAIEMAHRRGILHRDLKPDNVLIDREGRPRITDFGLAKPVDDDAELTASGQLVGTPAFMAPEQVPGQPYAVGPSADIYGLGGILYVLLTGRAPFHAPRLSDLIAQVVERPVTPPRELVPSVPPELESICLKCLEKGPSKRYLSAGAVAHALRQVCGPMPSGAALTPVPVGLATQSWAATPLPQTLAQTTVVSAAPSAPPRRRGLALTVAAVLVVFLAGALGGALLLRANLPGGQQKARRSQRTVPGVNRKDFPLKIELVGHEEEEVPKLVSGQRVRLRVTSGKDAHIAIFSTDTDDTIVRIFPNDDERNNSVTKDVPRTIPGADYPLEVEGDGIEEVRVVASTRPFPAVRGEHKDRYQFLTLKAFAEKMRPIRVGPAVSEASLKYEIVPRE